MDNPVVLGSQSLAWLRVWGAGLNISPSVSSSAVTIGGRDDEDSVQPLTKPVPGSELTLRLSDLPPGAAQG